LSKVGNREVHALGIGGNWDRRVSRRDFLSVGGLSAAALLLGPKAIAANRGGSAGYGDLVPDPGGLIDLPRGFQYRVISPKGSPLSSGGTVPGDPDGMAAFPGPSSNTALLVRNHELRPEDGAPVVGKNPYDPTQTGGTTGILVNLDDRTEIRDFVTSSGTRNNCAGGGTPWGTWLTCEEDRTTNHGYVFEVDPSDPENDLSKTPIQAMGFFSHEAVDIDPKTGIAYLTEDDGRGAVLVDATAEVVDDYTTSETNPATGQNGTGSRVSFLYRYIPNDTSQRPGALLQGGKLQVLTIDQLNYNMDLANPGQKFGVLWKDVKPEEPHESAEDLGAARFDRLEGAYFAGGAFWFDDTNGGEKRLGQIFRLIPSGGYGDTGDVLELFYEGTEPGKMESPDNIVVTPWGDLWFAEDEAPVTGVVAGDNENRIMGITPDGQAYVFARNAASDSEFAGPTFSPDGETLFVNMQGDGLTFAIWGPFAHRSSTRQRKMAVAAPPAHMAPRVSGELAEAAQKFGMSPLEAAAYDRLGISIA
jgi:secreted PhoX family phosphatase